MACGLTITGRAFPCKDGIGGIKKVWIAEFGDITWGAISAGAVTTCEETTPAIYEFEINKNSGSFAQTVNASPDNGTVFYTQTLSFTMPKLVAGDTQEVHDLMTGRLSIVVQDNNDNYLIMGHATGADSSGGGIGTGAAKGDLNGYELEFVSEEAQPAPHLTDLAILNFTDAS